MYQAQEPEKRVAPNQLRPDLDALGPQAEDDAGARGRGAAIEKAGRSEALAGAAPPHARDAAGARSEPEARYSVPTDGNTEVSVVIPTCNRGDYLREAVQSALAQTGGIREVIVVDDASETDPAPLLADLGDRVQVHHMGQRGGANVARNHGIAQASGTFVAFLDDDDIWLPEKTRTQLSVMAREQEARAAAGNAADVEACMCIARGMDGEADKPRHLADVQARLRISIPGGTSGLIARRAALLAEPFDITLRSAQDWDVAIRLAQRGGLLLVETPLYIRRTGHDRITTRVISQTPEELYQTAAATHKHRAWLGEAAYRRRMAVIMLSYISQRRNKLRYLAASLRYGGLRATLSALAAKLR